MGHTYGANEANLEELIVVDGAQSRWRLITRSA